jgi:hypothetical protein
MDAWWWVAIGLLAWFGVSLAAGLLLGRFFSRSSQARDALDAQERALGAQEREALAERLDPPEDGPRVA